MRLDQLGWDSLFAEEFVRYERDGLVPARVSREDRQAYQVVCESGELPARVSGRFQHEALSPEDFPGVGDWVAVQLVPDEQKAVIQAVLQRKSCFVRQEAGGRTEAQIVAANVDTVFIVSGLDGGRAFNLRRIERYLALTRECGAEPVIVLNKADLCDDVPDCKARAATISSGAPVHAVSALEGVGIEDLRAYVTVGATAALLGSSGVGKSALVNALCGIHLQATGAVREDDHQGRHTTTHRELIPLPDGGVLIDTPGMRELRLWGDEESLHETFSDVHALAERCRFSDCRHEQEPGCAVQDALEDGSLDPSRVDSYMRLQREMQHLARRQDQRTRGNSKARHKDISKFARQLHKMRGRK